MSPYSIQVVLDLFLPSAYFSFAFEVSQEYPARPYWPCTTFAHLSVIWNGPILCFEEAVLEDQLAVPGTVNCHPCDPAQQIPKQAEICSPEVKAGNSTICFAHLSQDF